MGTPFDITPPDFLGAANQWQQDLAQTAQMQSQARQGQQHEQQNDIKLQQQREQMQQHAQLMEDVKALPQAMPAR